jgi:hypothetical protein
MQTDTPRTKLNSYLGRLCCAVNAYVRCPECNWTTCKDCSYEFIHSLPQRKDLTADQREGNNALIDMHIHQLGEVGRFSWASKNHWPVK